MSSSTPVGTSVQGGAEIPGSIDVDALERRFKACDPNYNYYKIEEVVRDMLTALRQQQEALEKERKTFREVQDAEIARLRAVIEEAPHTDECERWFQSTGLSKCSCWKRKALENKE